MASHDRADAVPSRPDPLPWWQRGVVYQIYPRSFGDSDGDGVGDLRGILERLGHLRRTTDSLGVDAIWLSPFYPSPMVDFGYDVSDYTAVDPIFGTLADFDALLEDAHSRNIKLIIDWVPNHTSDQHPWFLESRAGRDSPNRDWYVWRDPAPGGGPPNNWRSAFGGVAPAWTFDEATRQFYLNSFTPQQPDLNWDKSGGPPAARAPRRQADVAGRVPAGAARGPGRLLLPARARRAVARGAQLQRATRRREALGGVGDRHARAVDRQRAGTRHDRPARAGA